MQSAVKNYIDDNALFYEYRKTGDKKIRDELVHSYLYIAEILSKIFIRLRAWVFCMPLNALTPTVA